MASNGLCSSVTKVRNSNYEILEYIEATGAQYINTNISPTYDNQIELVFSTNSLNQDGDPLGASYSASSAANEINVNNNIITIKHVSNTVTTSITADTKYTAVVNYSGAWVNGTQIGSWSTGASSTYKYYIAAHNKYGSPLNYFTGNIYSVKIYISYGSTISFNGVPVRRISDGAVGMLDSVSGNFFSSATSTAFIAGPVVTPASASSYVTMVKAGNYEILEYVKSTGAQYIRPVGTINNEKFEITFSTDTTDVSGALMGNGTRNNWSWKEIRIDNGVIKFVLGNTNTATYNYAANTKYKLEMCMEGVFVNGTKIVSFSSSPFSSFSNAICAFSTGLAEVADCVSANIYSAAIYNYTAKTTSFNGTPARRLSDGAIGFLDSISGNFFASATSTAFVAGPVVTPAYISSYKTFVPRYYTLEYIESTGTQYIDTGIDYFADFEFDGYLTSNVVNKTIGLNSDSSYQMERSSESNPVWEFTSGSSIFTSSISILEHHTLRWKNNIIYADGIQVGTNTKTTSVTGDLVLFAGKYDSVLRSFSNIRAYNLKVWDTSGNLIRDLIPAKRISDNAIGLYDKVNDTFYPNKGTGVFTAGSITGTI